MSAAQPIRFRNEQAEVQTAALASALAAAIGGEVRFDAGSRAVYSADASNYRQIPIGVVLPRTFEDVVAAVRICREHGAPLLPRGGGTSQCGQCVNVAVVLDFSKYLGSVVSVDAAARTALVQPGTVCDALKSAAEAHGLTFGPDPATHSRCTLGGMIGNNSCGAHSVMAGKTVENIEALEVLTYDGARFWAGPTPATELEAIIAKGGRQGEISPGSRPCATNTRTLSARNFRRSSAAYRVTTSTSCCQRTDSTSRVPWWAARAPARLRCRQSRSSSPTPPRACC